MTLSNSPKQNHSNDDRDHSNDTLNWYHELVRKLEPSRNVPEILYNKSNDKNGQEPPAKSYTIGFYKTDELCFWLRLVIAIVFTTGIPLSPLLWLFLSAFSSK